MNDCPLVRLAKNLKILRKYEQSGQVAIPVTDWLWFFESLDYINRDSGPQVIYSMIVEGYLVFSQNAVQEETGCGAEAAGFIRQVNDTDTQLPTINPRPPCPACCTPLDP